MSIAGQVAWGCKRYDGNIGMESVNAHPVRSGATMSGPFPTRNYLPGNPQARPPGLYAQAKAYATLSANDSGQV